MVRLIVLFLLLKFSTGICQSPFPTGDFYTKKRDIGFESELFQLSSDRSFKYVKFGCVEIEIGQGNYEVRNDSLILSFENNPIVNQFQKIDITRGSTDKLVADIEVKLSDVNGGSAGISCYLKDQKQGSITDFDGHARMEVQKKFERDTLAISFIGYRTVYVPVTADMDEIKVRVTLTNLFFYEDGQKLSFKINRFKKRFFELQRYDKLSISYEKVTREKSNEIISKVIL